MTATTFSPIGWNATKEEIILIGQIAKRAHALCLRLGVVPWNHAEVMMDIEAAHCNGCPLDLERLLAFNDRDFSHDVGGIRGHLNRQTGTLENGFVPRCYAVREVVTPVSRENCERCRRLLPCMKHSASPQGGPK